MKNKLGALLAAVLAGGCASAPEMRFYTLSEVRPQAAPANVLDGASVRLVHVVIPGEIDRSQLVRRLDANRLQIVEQDRWAAPLDEVILRVLSADIAARIHPNATSAASDPAKAAAAHALSVNIQEFSGGADCAVTLRATWTLKTLKQSEIKGEAAVRTEPTGACATSALPGAMSDALGQLSDTIVAGLASVPL